MGYTRVTDADDRRRPTAAARALPLIRTFTVGSGIPPDRPTPPRGDASSRTFTAGSDFHRAPERTTSFDLLNIVRPRVCSGSGTWFGSQHRSAQARAEIRLRPGPRTDDRCPCGGTSRRSGSYPAGMSRPLLLLVLACGAAVGPAGDQPADRLQKARAAGIGRAGGDRGAVGLRGRDLPAGTARRPAPVRPLLVASSGYRAGPARRQHGGHAATLREGLRAAHMTCAFHCGSSGSWLGVRA